MKKMPPGWIGDRQSVRSQLDAFAGLGYLHWQPGIEGKFLVTPTGGSELRLNLREAYLFVSGLALGAQGRPKP